MRRLAAEGLIDMQHHRGARVRQLSRAEVHALFEVREVLEGLSARLAALNTTAVHERQDLADLAQTMNDAAVNGAVEDYVALNNSFHNLLVSLSGNPILPQMLGRLHTQAMRYQFRQLADPASTLASNREHQRIVRAVLDDDAEYAERAMRQHVQRSRDMMTSMPDTMFAVVNQD